MHSGIKTVSMHLKPILLSGANPLRYFFRQFFTAVLILAAASCGRTRVPIDKSVFNISDADLVEQDAVSAASAGEEGESEKIVLKKPPAERFRVGFLIPLTGTAAKLGENLQNAAMMALFDMKGKGCDTSNPNGVSRAWTLSL